MGACGVPQDQLGLRGDPGVRGGLSLDDVQQHLGGGLSHPRVGLGHGGYIGLIDAAQVDIVKARHLDIAGDEPALKLQGLDRADGDQVAAGRHGGEGHLLLHQPFDGVEAVCDGELSLADELRPGRDAVLLQRS